MAELELSGLWQSAQSTSLLPPVRSSPRLDRDANEHLKKHWGGLFTEPAILVVGVFIGLQSQ
jgi:hypothetical protein